MYQVILGGGRKFLMPMTELDPEYRNRVGLRTDTRNIINEWLHEKRSRGAKAKYVWNKEAFNRVDPAETDYLMGQCLRNENWFYVEMWHFRKCIKYMKTN